MTRSDPPLRPPAFHDPREGGCWRVFSRPREVLAAGALDEVAPLLARVEAALASGLWAAGMLAYEAAPALDPALPAAPPGPWPLAWFVLAEEPERRARLPAPAAPEPALELAPAWPRQRYLAAAAAVRAAIARGETYQANLTFPLRGRLAGDPWELFTGLWRRQPADWAAFLDTGCWAVASLSPELFFHRAGERVVTRPMKGTAERGRWPEEDAERRAALVASPKERAENLMIVDMLRNDLGRVARPGSVAVEELFTAERLATLWQMTSTVSARTGASPSELLRALFPCASVTGAPKRRTMALLRDLEGEPRGLYTGAIGWLAPGGRAAFNVAIRTVVVDRETGEAEYRVGSGVVWDSEPEREHRECLAKAAAVLDRPQPFRLLETLLWRPGRGYRLLAAHLERMASSAAYFGFAPPAAAAERLEELAAALPAAPHRVRLLADRDGEMEIEAAPLAPGPAVWRLVVAPEPVDPASPFLFHKTTRRDLYDRALAAATAAGADEALLWNPAGELTEATRFNLVIALDGELLTPPVASGLLPGLLRARLLARGRVREAVVRKEDLRRAGALWLVNSVRGVVRGELEVCGDW